MAQILIIDDSSAIRKLVAFTLADAGHEVTSAENGEAGLHFAESGQYDLILCDVNMPVMDGITTVTNLRKMENYRFTPVLYLTTEASRPMKEKGRTAGASGWIIKPFKPDKLIQLIGKFVS